MRGVLINRLKSPAGLVTLAMGIYWALMNMACWTKYSFYRYTDFDLAHHSQSLWNILHGDSSCSILGIPFLGNHMVLILYLVAPLYALWSSPLLLLFIQTTALAATAYVLFCLARRKLGDRAALILSIMYLVYPPLLYMNLFEFHPVVLAIPFLTAAFLCFELNRFAYCFACLLLATLCQENVALIMTMFGIYAAVRGRRNHWCWGPVLFGIVYFVLAVGIVMPRLNQDRIQFMRLYSHLGTSFGEWVTTLLTRPGMVLACMFQPEKLSFLNALLAPVGYLSLADPISLIPAVPALLQRLLSSRLSETSIAYHYQAEFIPFVFVAAITGWERVRKLRLPVFRMAWFAAVALLPLVSIWASGIPPVLAKALSTDGRDAIERRAMDTLAGTIPEGARTAATANFLTHLCNRAEVHALHHIYTGSYILSDKPYPVPALDFVLMDTLDPLTFSCSGFYGTNNYLRLQSLLSPDPWMLDARYGSCLLFKRGTRPDDKGYHVMPTRTVGTIPEGLVTNLACNIAGMQLLGCRPGMVGKDEWSDVLFYWRVADHPPAGEIIVTIQDCTTGSAASVVPGHRMWPPQSWPAGSVVEDQQVLPWSLLPDGMSRWRVSQFE